ncbi:MAG: ArsR family transcriptional regulator [Campylobacter sp.]|nr:ArsR family transcriptional regulator [Campylobacter sp.]
MNQIEIFKVLANESRLQILFWLKEPKQYFTRESGVDMDEFGVCVGEIQQMLGLTQSTVSSYLSQLQKAGLLIATRIGKWTYYKKDEEMIKGLSEFIKNEL